MDLVAHILILDIKKVPTARNIARGLGIPLPPLRKVPKDPPWQPYDRHTPLFLKVAEPLASAFLEALRQRGIDPLLSWDRQYSREELLAHRLIAVSTLTTRPNAEVHEKSRYRGAVGGCERCGSLAKLTGPLIFGADPEPDSNIVTAGTGEWLVSSKLAASLRTIPGMKRFRRITESGPWDDWRLFEVEPTLPPIDPSSTGCVWEEQCPVCRRDGFGSDNRNEPQVIRYRASDIGKVRPINGTYELTGNSIRERGGLLTLATPELIVTPEVARILLDETSGDVRLDPVELV